MRNKAGIGGKAPKLRFPEFLEPWKYEILAPYLEGYSERVPANTDLPIYSSTRTGLTYQKEYYAGQEMANEGEYGVVPKGYFVYRHMSDDGIFKFNINEIEEKLAVSKEYPVFRTVQLNSNFLLHKLNSGDDFKRFAMMQKKGGTRTRLYFNTLCSWKTLLPFPAEQRKIADCLSSIDALIAVQTQKLEVLKAHKKGLMQHLFPAEGETVPKLRFPEFRDAGEWEKKKAGTLFKNRTEEGEAGLPIYSVTMNDGMIKRSLMDRRVDDISEPEGNKKANKTDIVYNMMRMWQGAFGVVGEDCMVSPAYVILAPQNGVCSDFFGYLLKLPRYLRLLASHSQGLTPDRLRLYYKDFAHILLLSPSFPEQQKIADCLSSLDNLITAQTQTLEALRTHKKGLMQQLFPSADEARG